MKNLINFIQEKYLINNDIQTYTCHPEDKFELRKILEERLAKDKDADLNDIDVSQITDMGYNKFPDDTGLFEDLDPHNIDISEWDTSNVEDMAAMFWDCENFTGKGLENWNVSKVKNMGSMFHGCEKLNPDLSRWDVSNVKDMRWMFSDCKIFTGKGLENWDVSNVKNLNYTFNDCSNFDCDLNNWNLKSLGIACVSTFKNCGSLKNIPSWY